MVLKGRNLAILLVVAIALPLVGFKCEDEKTVYVGPGDVAPFVFDIPDQEAAAGTLFSLDVAPWVYDYEDNVIDMTFAVTTGLGSFSVSTYSHTYGTAGSYSVDFTVEDTGGNVSSGSFNIDIYDPPVAEFMASMTTGVVPFTVQFTDLSSGNVDTRSWDFGDTDTSTAINPSHTYDWPGTYTVTLTVTGPGGNDTETKVGYITVNPTPPSAAFSADSVFGDAPLDVNFTDESTGDIDTWDWDFGDGSGTSTEQDPTYQYANPGIYDVTLTVTGPGGTDAFTRHAYIRVLDVSTNIWYVDSSVLVSTGDGTTWTQAFETIWSGIEAATDGDIVYVADGTYTGASNIYLNFGGKNIYLEAYDLYGTGVTKIDCEGMGNAFIFENSETNDAVVDGFTIVNGSEEGGAAIIIVASSPIIKNCIMKYGECLGGGGVLVTNAGSPVIEDCVITDNYADGWGGGIYIENLSTVEITGCTISDNVAFELGGGIYFEDTASVHAKNCIITYNEVTDGSGGGIYGGNSPVTLVMENCTVDYNSAMDEGGGICTYYVNATLMNCSVSNNSAGPMEEAYGGGIAFYDGLLILDNCDISDNSIPIAAMAAGGGIYIDSDMSPTTLVATNCTIDGNGISAIAIALGGGISSGTAVLDIKDCSISGNTLDSMSLTSGLGTPIIGAGGGINIGMDSSFTYATINGCIVSDNEIWVTAIEEDTAIAMGGGINAGFIMSSGGENIYIKDTTAADNRIDLFAVTLEYAAIGGGISAVGLELELDNLTVLRNSVIAQGEEAIDGSLTGGGGVLAYGESLTIQNSKISNNQVDGGDNASGGGLFSGYASATITSCIMTGNSLDALEESMGGGLFAMGEATTPLLNMEHCIISGNQTFGTTTLGGGAYFGQTEGQILNCLITGNSSEHYGGGLFITESNIEMPVCTIAGNTAGESGGGIFNVLGTLEVTHCIIWNNTAGTSGNQVFDPGTPTVNLDYTILPDDVMDPDRFGGSLPSINEDASCINADPVFATGPSGNYYLDQLLSPGIDAGLPTAESVDLDAKTTAPDGTLDSGQVDLGYHYEP